jgi:hypothetical protein
MEQEKEANPIAEIFDEMFTLLEDLETRSVAVLEYLKAQGGVSDEKLAPYLDRAAAASDVRWRAARARMDHLLAPKPKSASEVEKDGKPKADSQPQQEKDSKAGSESKDLGKELGSSPGPTASAESKHNQSKDANTTKDEKSKESQPSDRKQNKEQAPASNAREKQASALAGSQQSETQKSDSSKNPDATQSGGENVANQQNGSEKLQTQKAAK